jgi:hypothetical protein
VAKVVERVQVLETTVEQELQSPGRVSSAVEQLSGLKSELGNMRQLMDEHPLQMAHRLQELEKNVAEAALAAQQEMAELRLSVNNGTISVIRQEMQKIAMDLVEEMERRFKTFEEKMLQTVGAEMMRMRTEVENAIVTLATHVANAAQRQRVMEDGMSAQMAAVLAQSVSPTSTSTAPVVPPRTEAHTNNRSRTRSRSADPPSTPMTAPSPMTPQQVPTVPVVEDMESKMVNALVAALQRMGMTTPTTRVPPVQPPTMEQPSSMPSQVLVNATTFGTGIPRIDRSRQRSGRPGAVGAAVMPVMSSGMGSGGAAAAIQQVQIAPIGATASPNMMVTMPVQLSAALLGAVPQKFSGDQQDWPEWRRRWLSFVENLLEAMPTVTDTQLLTIFKGVVDDASVEKLEGEQFRDPDLSYEEFFATMDLEFGGEDHTNLRSKWYSLRVRHAGSLKLRDWRSFIAPFFKLMAMVEDATEEEAERLMLKALPVEWRRKVEIEVSKRNREGLMVVEGLPFNMDGNMVHQFSQWRRASHRRK